jgi:hypothetical protein
MRALYLAAIGLLAASPAFASGFSFAGGDGTQAMSQGMTNVTGQASFHSPVGAFAVNQGNAWATANNHVSGSVSQAGNTGFSGGFAFGNGASFDATGLNQGFAFTAAGINTPIPANWNNPFGGTGGASQ